MLAVEQKQNCASGFVL